jgi:starvation-inducible DNA-binding protein
LLLKIDEVAERILTLGHTPNHNYSEYKKTSQIAESVQVSDGLKAVEDILNSFTIIISLQRELLALSADAGDERTNALMSDYIRAQEKLVWMYSASSISRLLLDLCVQSPSYRIEIAVRYLAA